MAQRYFKYPFGVAGDLTAVPDTTQGDGSVSYQQGFGPDYQRISTDPQKKPVPRRSTNQLYNDITSALKLLQENSAPDFITTADNGDSPFSYAAGVTVRYTDGKLYRSLVAANTTLPTDTTKWVEATSSGVPAGVMMAYAGTTAPNGYLLCFGQSVSRTAYAALFAAIGTNYGTGDGSTTFTLPDKRGRVSVGKDDMGGTAANRITAGVSGITATTLGAAGGSQAMQQHNHPVTDPQHTHDYTASNTGPRSGGGATDITAYSGISTTQPASTGISIGNTGAGNSQNVQPSQVDNWIIKI